MVSVLGFTREEEAAPSRRCSLAHPSSSSSLSLSSLELSDTKVYEPYIRAHRGTAAHFCEAVVLKLTRASKTKSVTNLGTGTALRHPTPYSLPLPSFLPVGSRFLARFATGSRRLPCATALRRERDSRLRTLRPRGERETTGYEVEGLVTCCLSLASRCSWFRQGLNQGHTCAGR